MKGIRGFSVMIYNGEFFSNCFLGGHCGENI